MFASIQIQRWRNEERERGYHGSLKIFFFRFFGGVCMSVSFFFFFWREKCYFSVFSFYLILGACGGHTCNIWIFILFYFLV